MPVTYLPANRIIAAKRTRTSPFGNRNASGYGSKIPTTHLVTLDDNRVRRVYSMCYSNAGSAYVLVKGETLFIDGDCEHRINQLESNAG